MKKKPEIFENSDGTWSVMVGDNLISRCKTREDAEEYVAAMRRGDC